MKIRKLLYGLSIVSLMTSCVTTSFYQVYTVQPTKESITSSDELFYEDENCKISYNLWDNGGDIGFNFHNKTDQNIYVRLNESNFILNGFAYDYFKHRTFTESENNSTSTAKSATNYMALSGINILTNKSKLAMAASVGHAVAIKENPIICIPSHTTKRISEYSINHTLIRNCDLFQYPKSKEIKTKSYTEQKSPIVFSNRITYEINGSSKLVENEFFVSEITNYPEPNFFEFEREEFCGQKSLSKVRKYRFYNPNKFYIKYSKGKNSWKH
ncbi:hypothetical protein [Zobellia uliginosa]|uniref:hypothetical protein n=1 Tax=Zobellia uliginosa TaxID=143224 RepID=UPI0026E39F07|nr:hypothetical protein [Zobellia uliginosa]MDO6517715.1 hypothetical protein [Zobellia uliginosa]